ncbi:RHS repeat-associated core domain-containing protein [Amycolatopsis oliviviridis]|uniref:Type IV secretion protein Rhs n=1 Tax=Amycolatopsis oliviviridis TaxID=1471590 RepID=A0ABQ3LGL6_9PSEU|nr:RHS repeat-associated core domain-containing protein [Amycolatopsis oliviviridis]GHH14816.1 type IV secretion protein Rhs [Amycolatopsis oliviviridis]
MSNPLVAPVKDSTTAVSGVPLLESATGLKSAIESKDWAGVAMGAVGTALDALTMAMDPIGAVFAAGVGWLIEHVGPLKEALNALTGNADEISAQAQTWTNVAKELESVSAELVDLVKKDLQSWKGDAADAYRGQSEDTAALIASAQKGCEGAASGVKTAGEVVAAVRTLVRDIIAELVGHLISWALQVVFTLGIGMTWVVPQVVAAVAKTASKIAQLTTKLVKALKALVPLLKKAGALFGDAGKALKGLKGGKVKSAGKPKDLDVKSKKPAGDKGGDSTTPSGDNPKGGDSTKPSGDHSTTKNGDSSTKPPGETKNDPPAGSVGDQGTTTSGAKNNTKVPDGGGSRSIKDNNTNPKENSSPPYCRPGSGDPIDMTTGRMMILETDVEIDAALPLSLRRSHFSTYRAGIGLGPTWASTVDQRLEVEDGEVGFAAEDGTLLTYPVAEGAVLPVEGPYWPLKRSPEGGYVIEQPDLQRMLYFTPDGVGGLPLTAIFDNDGQRIHFVHDLQGVLREIRHSGGTRVEVETTEGLVTAFTLLGDEETDRTELVRYRYDRDRRLTEVANSSGQALRYDYDGLGRVVRWTDRNGRSYEFTYDELSRCVRGAGADGHLAYTFTYDREARVNTATDSLGNTTEYHLNADFQLVKEVGPLGGANHFTWDRHDRVTAHTDELGRTTRWEYDERGDLVAYTFPDGAQRLFEYEDRRVVSLVEPDGAVWRREYDEAGRLAASVGPLGSTTRYTYGEDGNLRELVDEVGNRTTVASDRFGRAIEVTDPRGVTWRRTFDALGRVTEEVDPIGGTTRYEWTVEGAGWRRVAPDGTTQRRVYDAEGNVREEHDERGEVARTDFGAFDQPVTRIAPDGSRLRVEHDTELRMIAATNGDGRTWRFEYDAEGRTVREQDFDGRVLTYAYDAAGQLITRTNAAGEVTTYVYDLRGEVIEKRTADDVCRYAYDGAGRLVSAVNRDAEVTIAYDELGRVVAETCDGRTVISGYDLADRRIFRRTPSGAESRWDYDGCDAPATLVTGRHSIAFRHDAAGREVWRGLGAAELTQEWDPRHRLRAQSVTTTSGAVAQRRVYDWRPDDVYSGVQDQLLGRQEFTFDRGGRVVDVQRPGGAEHYAYDRSDSVAIQAPVAERYDVQGRLVSRAGWTYSWNGEDRLVGVTTPDGQRWQYRYDALGRRVAKQRMDGDVVVAETRFAWDGEVLAEQVETTAAGETRGTTWEWDCRQDTPVAQTDRVYADGRCVDERFCSIVTDFIGTPSELVDEAGRIAWYRDETLWGAPRATTSGPSTPLRFPGQYLDAETGLHYNRHRYYDPRTARYLSADPLGLTGGLNTHAYVPNPLLWSDPFGLVGPCRTGGLRPDKGGKGGKDKAKNSVGGLRYDQMAQNGKRGERNRFEHVKLHADNYPGTKADHGVFGTKGGNPWDDKKISKIIDQGWAKRNDKGTIVEHQSGGVTAYTIPMNKKIGYIDERVPDRHPDGSVKRDTWDKNTEQWFGDVVYKKDGGDWVREQKDLDHLKIVVKDDNSVITAYPDRIRDYNPDSTLKPERPGPPRRGHR